METNSPPAHYNFLLRHGKWSFSENTGFFGKGVLVSKAGPKSDPVRLAFVDFSTLNQNKEIGRLIEAAPELADLLDTINRWSPVILKMAGNNIEKFVLEEIFKDTRNLLDKIVK